MANTEHAMMDRLGIERLCVFGMPPIPFVQLAADVGVKWIGIGLKAMRYYNPEGYSDWSLQDDPRLVGDFRKALADHGVGVSMLEGFRIAPDIELESYARDMDMLASLGGKRLAAASTDRDKERTRDAFGYLAEMAGERGLDVVAEVGQPPNGNLAAALKTVAHVGRSNFKLMIDTMHFFRFGGSIAEIEAMDRSLIGYVQLADAPWESRFDSYMDEALHDRMTPGEGEFPLRDFLALVPEEVLISVEIPQRAAQLAGVTTKDRVAACIAAARGLLPE